MAVAINVAGSLYSGQGDVSGVGYVGEPTIAGGLTGVAYLIFATFNGTTGGLPTGINIAASGVAGLTSLGSVTTSTCIQTAWAGLMGSPAGSTPAVTFTWTGGGTATDIEALAVILTGVDQTALATSFTNFAVFGPTVGTNPAATVSSSTNGYAFAAFSNIASGDITAITQTLLIHGNAHTINWIAGDAAGTGGNITFTTTEGTSQSNQGISFNVVPVGGAAPAIPSGSSQTIYRIKNRVWR